jgi:hypothetical protein
MIHCSAVEERVHLISQILAQPTHGLVSQLSRTHQVSRQTFLLLLHCGNTTREGVKDHAVPCSVSCP